MSKYNPSNTSLTYAPTISSKTWKVVSPWVTKRAYASNPLSRLNFKQNYWARPAAQ